MSDLEILEKSILDYYLAKGYKVSEGEWGFMVDITTRWKSKYLKVQFFDENISIHSKSVFVTVQDTVELMFKKAIEHFKKVD